MKVLEMCLLIKEGDILTSFSNNRSNDLSFYIVKRVDDSIIYTNVAIVINGKLFETNEEVKFLSNDYGIIVDKYSRSVPTIYSKEIGFDSLYAEYQINHDKGAPIQNRAIGEYEHRDYKQIHLI